MSENWQVNLVNDGNDNSTSGNTSYNASQGSSMTSTPRTYNNSVSDAASQSIWNGKRKAAQSEDSNDNGSGRTSKLPRLTDVEIHPSSNYRATNAETSHVVAAFPSLGAVPSPSRQTRLHLSRSDPFSGPHPTEELYMPQCDGVPTWSEAQRASDNQAVQRLHRNPNQAKGSIFPNAQSSTINKPLKTENNIHLPSYHRSQAHRETLEWLEQYIMKGAELDSSERSPPPKCHPNTRVSLIQRANNWFNDPPPGKRLLWLRGLAGVGKSAIIQTLAEGWRDEDRLGASLFFSRERRHTNPARAFPSLAYQIAVQNPVYAKYISETVRRDPRPLNDRALDEQFRLLFTIPFTRKEIPIGDQTWVITLDGLDECGQDEQEQRHHRTIQVEFVKLISSFALRHPTVPLVWIIASRPEAHLKAVFDASDIRDTFFNVEVPADSEEACRDVERFLDTEFKKIRERFPDIIPDSEWPTHRQFVDIAKAASSLFAFADTIIRFIADPFVMNPVEQLKWVMLTIRQLLLSRKETKSPLAFLDRLYYGIVSRVPLETLQPVCQILGAVMFCDREKLKRSDGWSLTFICDVYNITPDSSVAALRHLHSVLLMPQNRTNLARPAFYHTSFRDFLLNPARSRTYSINLENAGQELMTCFQTWLPGNPNNTDSLKQNVLESIVLGLLTSKSWDWESSNGVQLKVGSICITVPHPDFQQLLDHVVIGLHKFCKTLQEPADIRQKVVGYDFFVRSQFFQETTLSMMELDLARGGFFDYTLSGYLELTNNLYPAGSERDERSRDFCSRMQNHPCPIPVLVIGKVVGKRVGLIQTSDVGQFWKEAKPCWIRDL